MMLQLISYTEKHLAFRNSAAFDGKIALCNTVLSGIIIMPYETSIIVIAFHLNFRTFNDKLNMLFRQ